MRNMKRILAMALAIVLIVGLLPSMTLKAAAAETVLDAAIFCSDVHGSTSDLKSVLSGIKTSGETYSSIGFVGDTCLTVANTESAVNSGLGYTPTVMFSYASSHDNENSADISTNWNYSGEVEGVSDYYLVYTIRETDMQNSSDAKTAAPAFTSWYNGLTAAQKALPIFIMSHRPLHDRRDDNAGAATWYDAISAAAESSDIVFFWGHNHTSENSVDTAAYYVAKNGTETFTVYNGDTVTPNFTYMNAGYINANGQNPARKGIATTVKITADSLIFQDYNSSGEYSGTYAHNVTVAREFANKTVKPSTLTVKGTDVFYAGESIDLAQVVSEIEITYTDGTTQTLTAGTASLSNLTYKITDSEGNEVSEPFSVEGTKTYTITYTYAVTVDGVNYAANAPYDITVIGYNTLTEWDNTEQVSVQATAIGLSKLTVTNAYGDPDLSGTFDDYMSVNVAMEGVKEDSKIAYSILVHEEIPTTGLVLYHVSDDGQTLTPITYTLTTTESGSSYLNFTSELTGTFAYGIIQVPEGYTLSKIEISNIAKTDYFVGTSLDMVSPVVIATYTKEGSEDFTRILYMLDNYAVFDGYTVSGYNKDEIGEQTITISYTDAGDSEGTEDDVTCTTTFKVHVWKSEFTSNDVTVKLDTENGSEYGVTGVTVGESTNSNITNAIQYVIEGDNYKAYEISLVYATGYSATKDYKTVTLPIPDGVENPVVYYVPEDGQAVYMNATNNGDGTMTFTTNHFSTYVLGDGTTIETESGNAPIDGTEDVTTTTKVAEEVTVYKLVSTPVSGKTYLIVNSNTGTGYGLDGDTTGYTTTAFTGGDGYYFSYDEATQSGTVFSAGSDVYLTTADGEAYLWTAGSDSFDIGYSSSGSIGNITNTLDPDGNAGAWTLNGNQLKINLKSYNSLFGSDTYSDFYLTNSGSNWDMATSGAANIYFYEPVTIYKVTEQETTVPGTEGGTYSVTGTDITDAVALNGETVTLNSALTFTSTSGTVTNITGWKVTYEVVTTKGNPTVISSITDNIATLSGVVGTAVVKATYTNGTHTAWAEFIVTAGSPDHYSINLHLNNGGTLGAEITAPVALKGVKAGDTYSVWAVVKAYASANDTEGVDLGALGNALTWIVSDESIAKIDPTTGVITFTGKQYGTIDVTVRYTGGDGIVYEDTITISVTASEFVVPGDGTNDFPEYPNEGAIRHDKTSTAVGNFSETGIAKVELSMSGVNYNKGSEIDVVVMLDMTGSMSSNGMIAAEEATVAFVEKIVKKEDGTYNNNRVAVYAFNSNSSSPFELVSLKSIKSDAELETANTAIKTASDKKTGGGTPFDEATQKCYDVLQAAKTDGTGNNRQQFCVFMSDGGPTSYAADDGDGTYTTVTNSGSGNTAITTYFSGYNSSTSSSWSFTLPSEYYTNLMKADNVTVYTVGLLLQNKPSNPSPYSSMTASTYDSTTDSLTSIGSHYYFTSRVLKQMASDESKYIDIFNVDNASKATAAFEAIAQDILAAATDVTVEDKIGSNYTMVFDAPNAAVNEADGDQEYYIEVMDYALNPVYTLATAFDALATYYTKSGDTYTKATNVTAANFASGTYYYISDYTRGNGTSLLKLYFGYKNGSYYAATDAAGTAAAEPTFAQVALGDKGTKFYWTTDANLADAGAVAITSNGVTYYFRSHGVSSEDEDFDSTKWYNMTSGAYASGTLETVELYSLVEIDKFADGVTYYTKNGDGTYTVASSYSDTEKYYVYSTSSTCDNMVIASPYFVYNAATKSLIWTMDEISSSEITLTYFLYLNNSGGFSGADNVPEMTPDTYTTNQFAYVDYTNFQGTECQLTFPVPQLTWNGAQVSYVFYLVNEQGQPVNSHGRVVPFSEAVYVTEMHTYHIVWNDLEQVAGLSADYLASGLVPDVYALYDDDASYSIHVYEDFNKSNLNNHFVIGGDVTDDYNTEGRTWTNANTTMVFNTKADGTKYYIPGAYVADNGNAPANQKNQTYWCKDYDVEGSFTKTEHTDEIYGTYYTYEVTAATYEGTGNQVPASSMSSTTGGTEIGDYVYYVDENEKIYTIIAKTDGEEVNAGFDFSNTTVAFAVVWKPELVQDTVIVDFGLDVIIDVIKNDNMVPGVVGVLTDAPEGVEINKESFMDPQKSATAAVMLNDLLIGTASTIKDDNAHIRFSFNKENGMLINGPITFYYEANVQYYENGTMQDTFKYSSVTIIPATTVYFEDEFVTLTSSVKQEDGTYETTIGWDTNSTAASGVQDCDRPGANKISKDYDADNNYGYDSAYESMATHSMGNAAMVNVYSGKYANAEFEFYGTGFDIISLTDSTTGYILVSVYDTNGTKVKYGSVNTYYGYAYGDSDGDGTKEWYTVDSNSPNALYQVPVIKMSGLDYAKYTVKITVSYVSAMDKTSDAGYNFYLDAIRIYDPCGTDNTTANGAYKDDSEGWPEYTELRNMVLSATEVESLGDVTQEGVVFIDGGVYIDGKAEATVSDYKSYGPNNELYLAAGQSIAFDLADPANVAKIQLGIKTVGGTASVLVYSVDANGTTIETAVKQDITTATDMYYDITALKGQTVIIKNDSGAIVSLTNVKVTYTQAPATAVSEEAGAAAASYGLKRLSGNMTTMSTAATTTVDTVSDGVEIAEANTYLLSVSAETVSYAIMSLNAVEEEVEPEAPVVPEEPVEPEIPEEPEVPETPEEPAEPEVPEEPAEPEVFQPEKLEISLDKGKVKEGEKVKVNVRTSDDVDYITVNGEIVTRYREDRRTGDRIWTVQLRAEEAGDMTIEVIAYNEDGLASEAATALLKVQEKKKGHEDFIRDILDWLFG